MLSSVEALNAELIALRPQPGLAARSIRHGVRAGRDFARFGFLAPVGGKMASLDQALAGSLGHD